MIVTFPHMGNTCFVIKTLCESLDIEFLIPPPCSKHTLELGTKYSPEQACLPLKITLGNFIESIEKGADTIVMTGGCGPCRFGYYGQMHREILKDVGYDVDVIVLEVPNGRDIKEFLRRVRKLSGNQSILRILKAIKNATDVSIKLDKLDTLSYKIRPREKKKGKTDWIMKKFHHQMFKTKGFKEILDCIEQTQKELERIEIDSTLKPLKIGIVGEIYTVIEPFTNINVIQILGNMGVEVDCSVSLSNWIVEHIIKGAFHLKKNKLYEETAKPYLKTMVGGHGQETIGNSILYAENGYDGVIQLYPFTCMPEIVAESILPTVSKDLNIPILTLIIDELTGEAGYKTRIEAFVDMIELRRERSLIKNENILYGN